MSCWDVSGVPEAYDWMVIGLDADAGMKSEILSQLETEVDANGDFIVNKVSSFSEFILDIFIPRTRTQSANRGTLNTFVPSDFQINACTIASFQSNPSMVLYAEPIVDTKKKRGSKEIWPSDSQQWFLTKVLP